MQQEGYRRDARQGVVDALRLRLTDTTDGGSVQEADKEEIIEQFLGQSWQIFGP